MIPTKGIEVKKLLKPIFRNGARIGGREPLQKLRKRTRDNLASFDPAIFRLDNPHAYAAGLSQTLFERRQTMRAREFEEVKVRLASVNNNGMGSNNSISVEDKP